MRWKLCHFCHQLCHFSISSNLMDLYGVMSVHDFCGGKTIFKNCQRRVKSRVKCVTQMDEIFLLLSELNVTTNTSVIQWRHICHTIHTVINLSTDSGTEFFIYRNSKSKSSSKMTIFERKKQSDQNQQKTLVRKKSEIPDLIQNS